MRFAVGYQRPENGESFPALVRDYTPAVAEVYFSWPGHASGRGGCVADWSDREVLEDDLKQLRRDGVALDLLFNANCYGGRAVSSAFEREIGSLLEHLDGLGLMPDIVTATSPFVADRVRCYFPTVERRASVNMRIDSTLALEYVADLFDSFHLRRDLQRDLPTVARFHDWAKAHGKKLCLIVNSGCLRNCPSQTFHDNLVAHDEAAAETRNVRDFAPHLCRRLYADRARWVEFLRGSWIRPEDLGAYEPYVSAAKLATRRHSHPRIVLGAYTSGRYDGNLADLTEPGFSGVFAPFIIDNRRFPGDWPEIAGACAAECRHCGRCEAVLDKVLQHPFFCCPRPQNGKSTTQNNV